MERGLVSTGAPVLFEISFMPFFSFPGPSERSIHLAKLEIKRVVKEEMIRLVSKTNYARRFLESLIPLFCLTFFEGKKFGQRALTPWNSFLVICLITFVMLGKHF